LPLLVADKGVRRLIVAVGSASGVRAADLFRVEVKGKRVYYRVECHAAHGVVGDGMHERAVIHVERFAERLDSKR